MDRFKQVKRDVGRRVFELREARGLSQEEFAEHMGWTPRYQQAIEGGTEAVSLKQLVRIADALELHVRELFAAPTSAPKPGRPRRRKKIVEGPEGEGSF